MADHERRCLPPCQRQLSDEDLHAFCFVCLGEEHAIRGLEGECEHCDLLSIKVLRVRLAFFKSSWGSRVDLAEARETDSPLSLALSPDHEALASVSQARSAFLLNGPTRLHLLLLGGGKCHLSALLSWWKSLWGVLEVVTRAVDRLHLDWPQEQETSKCSKLDDRYLSGGQGEGPQRRSLPFFGDLHDEGNSFMEQTVFVPCFCAIDVDLLDYRWCKARGYMMMPQIEETLASYLSPGSSSSLKKATLPTKPCRVTSSLVGKAFQAGVRLVLLCILWRFCKHTRLTCWKIWAQAGQLTKRHF